MPTFDNIKNNILSYTRRNKPNSNRSSWYIGITNDLADAKNRHERRFKLKYLPNFFYWQCNDVKQAKNLETYFIRKLGFSGSEGGPTSNTNKIYVFFKGRKKSND